MLNILNRLLRVICGILFIISLPLGIVIYAISYVLTGNALVEDIVEWLTDDIN
jgi:hypothetical protein